MAQSTNLQSLSDPLVSQELTLEVLQEALRMHTEVLVEKITAAFDESFKKVFETKELIQTRNNETRKETVLVPQGVAEHTGLMEESGEVEIVGGEQSEEDIYQPNENFQIIVGKALSKMDYQKNLREILEESFALLSATLKNEFDWQTGNIYSVNLSGQKQLPRDTGTYFIKKKKTRKRLLQVSYKKKPQVAMKHAFVVREFRNRQKLVRGAPDGKAGCLLLPEVNRRKGTEMARNGIG